MRKPVAAVFVLSVGGFVSGVAFVGACGSQEEADADIIKQAVSVVPVTQIVQSSDSDGVGSVVCPAGTVVTGGGCSCTLYPAPRSVVFSASPSGNGFVCGCDDFNVVKSFAVCMGTPINGALTVHDAELWAAVAAAESQQRAMLGLD